MYTEQEGKALAREYEKKLAGRKVGQDIETLWHNRVYGRYVADAVFAANDGIITTFAVVAGVAGAGISPSVVIILGIANLLADAASMGLGNYLGQKSEQSYNALQQKKEAWEIDTMPEQQIEELRTVFAAKGFAGEELDQLVKIISSNKKVWIETLLREEVQLVDDHNNSPAKHGAVTWVSFIVAGILPLLPFVIPFMYSNGFGWSIAMTFIALFVVGACRSVVVASRWWKAGFEMLLVGGIAAVIAYGVGLFLAQLVGVVS